ncbi:EAL domain-containing protein [Thiotrichales bacterium 19S9-12]|nr:EAL domain-containing protein [Thiotrichales bacterium 19S9-11]MCF6811503.1 EAL domain-containing protein [Thiotrichales bacterium 19S9-12]
MTKLQTLWLITDNQHMISIITQFTSKYNIKVIDKQQVRNLTKIPTDPLDAILIGSDLTVDFFNHMLNTNILDIPPVIYLYHQADENQLDAQFQTKINDSLNLDKLTQVGFERALSNITEKHHMLMELNTQINLLKNLTGSFGKKEAIGYCENTSNHEILSIKELIKENKLLIEKVYQQNEALKQLARNDVLTDIPNRRSFEETLTSLLSHAQRHGHILAILFIDLDKFKNVNDTLGHHIGDALLQSVTRRLKKCLRKGDFVARIGGDEFAVILHELKSTHAAGIVAWKIIEELDKAYTLEGHTVNIGASIGISCYPTISGSMDDLVKSADIAMYQAKASKENKYEYATQTLQKDHVKRLEIETELRYAIDRNELTMAYQPIFTLPTCQLHGFEALIRWNNQKLGSIMPDQFIPIAEESGIIHSLGQWIFEAVCKQIASWQDSKYFNYHISINLSPVQLSEEALFMMINDIIQKYQLPYNIFEFEITEMAIMQHGSTMLDKLHKLGTSHALDDFGTGYSSISHLKYLPIKTIKIDKTFIQGLGVEESDNGIVSSLIALARKMGLKVVAEGVENKAQLNTLISEKCDLAQGFYFSKPLTPDDAFQLIQSSQTTMINKTQF